jgi:nitroreductase
VVTTDPYQERYLAHQARKRESLRELMLARHSDRVYDEERAVPDELIVELTNAAGRAPSSCDRHAISLRQLTDRQDRELLGGLLVGGVGWVHRAPFILLLLADSAAYKAAGELSRMPYLDAGAVLSHLYLAAVASGLSCCYVNPAVRPRSEEHFRTALRLDDMIFCGAFAAGWPAS